MSKNIRTHKGYAALVAVLITGTVVLVVSLGASFFAVSGANINADKTNRAKALSLSETCAEYALQQLSDDAEYSGNETVAIDSYGTCDILSVEGSGNKDRTIKATASSSNSVRKIQVEVSRISPSIKIDSWKTVKDFN